MGSDFTGSSCTILLPHEGKTLGVSVTMHVCARWTPGGIGTHRSLKEGQLRLWSTVPSRARGSHSQLKANSQVYFRLRRLICGCRNGPVSLLCRCLDCSFLWISHGYEIFPVSCLNELRLGRWLACMCQSPKNRLDGDYTVVCAWPRVGSVSSRGFVGCVRMLLWRTYGHAELKRRCRAGHSYKCCRARD